MLHITHKLVSVIMYVKKYFLPNIIKLVVACHLKIQRYDYFLSSKVACQIEIQNELY